MVPATQAVEEQKPAEPGLDPELKSRRCLVIYLCFYGFMAQMRPGESFITPYLLGPDKNFTRKQVTNEITPVLSYSYLATLVPVFLLTDYLRYKPVLVLQGLSYISVWLLLLWGSTVLHMQFMELVYSITMAARIAYSSYIFVLVRPAHYQRMASCSRAAVLLGVFTSGVLGQLLLSVAGCSFTKLNYISLAFLTFSLVLALFLRCPKRSLFFNNSAGRPGAASPSELDRMNPLPGLRAGGKRVAALRVAMWDLVLVRMLRELVHSLRRPQLRLWSLWWVFSSVGYYLIVYYVHILWNVVNPTEDTTAVYNGGADAASTLLSTSCPVRSPATHPPYPLPPSSWVHPAPAPASHAAPAPRTECPVPSHPSLAPPACPAPTSSVPCPSAPTSRPASQSQNVLVAVPQVPSPPLPRAS